MSPNRLACTIGGTAIAAALTLTNWAWAADSATDKAVQQRFKQESVACINLPDRASEQACLKEARAARAEAKDKQLSNNNEDFAANAQARCKGLPAPEEKTCLERMRQGTKTGSVQGGGVLRELTVPVVPTSAGASQPQ